MSKTQILIVEDDQPLSKMLSQVLTMHGYEVFSAGDQFSALAQLEKIPTIRCVIQDLGLPPNPSSMEAGLATMRKLLQFMPSIKIIVLTGRGKHEAAIQAVKEGAFDFFEKPVTSDMLLASIERSLLFSDAEKAMQDEGLYSIRFNSALEEEGLKGTKDEFEAQLLKRVLIESHYNVKTAAERLGTRRENVYYLLRKHGIDLDRVLEESPVES